MDSLSWLPYHFEFLIGDRPAFSVVKKWGLRDKYVVTIHDPQLDRRLVVAMAVALDALQSRLDRQRRSVGMDDPRARRLFGDSLVAPGDLAASPFRVDRDRIVSSPFFARLAGVTQVISPGGAGLLVHNRLTHSLKVAQVGRAIAERLAADPRYADLLEKLGGCDPDVVEAAALAHDLGHPPFGHLGERVLDQLARQRLRLRDGFEGNAQSYRIVTSTEIRGQATIGLNLTAAIRAAILKYPWTRRTHPAPHPRFMDPPPRGAAAPAGRPGRRVAEVRRVLDRGRRHASQARAPFAGRVADWQQTVEASVMDTADDIAYAIHDLEDVHRVGVLQQGAVAAELMAWQRTSPGMPDDGPGTVRRPGSSIEALRRQLHRKDGWMADDDAFAAAVEQVRAELVDGLLAAPVRRLAGGGGAGRGVLGDLDPAAGRRRSRSTGQPGGPLRARAAGPGAVARGAGAQVRAEPVRAGPPRPGPAPARPGPAAGVAGRGAAGLAGRPGRGRAAARAACATWSSWPRRSCRTAPRTGSSRARGRAVIDFVAALTDSQAVALMEALSGRTRQLWTDAFVL